MHVLYCSQGYSPHDYRFLRALQGSGKQVSFLSFGAGAKLDSRPVPSGIRDLRLEHTWRWPRRLRTLEAYLRLPRILSAVQPDLVHAGPIQPVAFPFALHGIHPLVAMSWGSDLLGGARRGLERWKASLALRRCDAFLCDSPAVETMAESLGLPAGRTVIFPWGVDLAQFSPGTDEGVRAGSGWEREVILLCTRNWESIYGVDLVVTAFEQVARQLSQVRLVLVGDGALHAQIRERIEDGALQGVVLAPGRVDYRDLPSYYRAADIYLSASHSDGTSVSLLEAMASGLPSIVSDIPGNRPWITDGVTGLLFPDGDAGALAQCISILVLDPRLRSALGQAARHFVEKHADWTKNVARMDDAYQMAFEHGGGR